MTTEVERYLGWLERQRGLHFATYHSLHSWSVRDLDGFWSSIAEYFGVRAKAPMTPVLGRREMPGAQWFPRTALNYAEHALGLAHGRHHAERPADEVCIRAHSQTRGYTELTWAQLRDEVARARTGLAALGVGRGDRVVGYLPNIPETVVAYLATASLGAIWAACAPEFGSRSVVDRFAQVEPRVLLTVSGYDYGERSVDRRDEVAAIRTGLPTVTDVVHVPYGEHSEPLSDAVDWQELLGRPGTLEFDPVPFEHPLCLLFSSGTTGLPKAIVHGHGGILLEHLKNHGLSWDLRPGDRMLWFSTTAWMMWNALVSGLLTGACIVLVDGNPQYPDLSWQWSLAERSRATLMGVSPGYLMACRREGFAPAQSFDLSSIRQLGAAGSPLAPEGYRWVAEQFGPDVLLNVGSGGTDVCTALVQGGPLQPAVVGEISGPCLGVDAHAYDQDGRPVLGELGELVVAAPMPSMPVGFWGDLPVEDPSSRYRDTYFATYPGIWRHGDWVRFADGGSCVIAGRSDATLNRGGVRLGTAEFYAVVEELPQVQDSLVVHLEEPSGGDGRLLLYVVLRDGDELDDSLRHTITTALRSDLSPRHVPDEIHAVPAIPRNRTGKKLELPVKRLLLGAHLEDVAALDVLADPRSLDPFLVQAAPRGTA